MTTWHRGFILEDVGAVYRTFQETMALLNAEAAANPALRRAYRAQAAEIRRIEVRWANSIDRAAVVAAQQATAAIRRRLKATAKRTPTGKSPSLEKAIFCARAVIVAGIKTGAVGIADEDRLNAVTNPFSPGYGPYWRAQEYGTGSREVKSQIGRQLYGYYVGKGGGGTPERPRAQYRGGGGPHPIFVASSAQTAIFGGVGFTGGAGKRGGLGGPGQIHHEIAGRHFIRDGAAIARRGWQTALADAKFRAIAGIKRLEGLSAAEVAALRRV